MNFVWEDSLTYYKARDHIKGVPADNRPHWPSDVSEAAGGQHTTANDNAKVIFRLMDFNDRLSSELLKLQASLPAEPERLFRSLGSPCKLADGIQL